ncbi:MAG: hypothetical protein JWM63_3017 [Gammaproteobacteria bacterium]|nr:hypothetical protein [Gammaproteobacteria bacterium]
MPVTLIICMMATCITQTAITLTSMFWKSTRQIPINVRLTMSVADMTGLMHTVPAVDMSAFHTVTTLTTWLKATCIIHMGITVMITALSR